MTDVTGERGATPQYSSVDTDSKYTSITDILTEARQTFSSRFTWDLRPNRLTELLASKRQAGRKIFDLTESNPTRAGLVYEKAQVLESLADPRSLVYEPQPAGLAMARDAVAGYYTARGRPVDPARILLTASTSEAYAYVFKLMAGPGDEVVVPQPSYPLLEFLAAMECVRIRHYPLAYREGWRLDIEGLRAAISSRARAVVVVNPNNPTGSFLKRDEADALVDVCASRNLALLSDEVFSDYGLEPGPERVATLAGLDRVLTFSLSGLSKIVGLPQVKLSWMVVSGPPALLGQAIERLELIADTYLSVGAPVQHAAARLLLLRPAFQGQVLERLRENLELLRRGVESESACRLLNVEGGWYATVQLPRSRSEEEWVLALLGEDDVLVQPGFFYDFDEEAFVVLSLLTPPETFREGVRRLLTRVAGR